MRARLGSPTSSLADLSLPDRWKHKLKNFPNGASNLDQTQNLLATIVSELHAKLREVRLRNTPNIELQNFRPKKSRDCTLAISWAKAKPMRRKNYRVELGHRFVAIGDEVIGVSSAHGVQILILVLVRELTKFINAENE